ncbi:MAG: hypothetical protein GKS03_13840 [Alphaproteobacteria bacterium]|nr:hypothetical protein [Alphaproteobacteria bacterium]
MHRTFIMITVAAVLSGCGAMGEFFPDFDSSTSGGGSSMMMDRQAPGMGNVGSVRPETLVSCRGHVLVPAMGMTFVPYGSAAPSSGQFLREESLTPPYRVLPPGAAATMDNVPSRLNVDVDRNNRIINIRCG